MTEEPSGALESQIQVLERQLAEKRAELGGDTSRPYERAEVHAAVGEQIRQSIPSYQAVVPAPVASAQSVQDPSLVAPLQDLVNIAFTDSIQAAISQALASHNPALVDALHDVLTDQFHQELVNRQKIQPAP